MKTTLLVLLAGLAAGSLPASAAGLQMGQRYYLGNVTPTRVVTAIGRDSKGEYILRWESGPWAGSLFTKNGTSEMGRLWGCLKRGYCVGDRFLNEGRRFEQVTIVGIGFDGDLFLRFDTGAFQGLVGSGWHAADLVPLEYEKYKY